MSKHIATAGQQTTREWEAWFEGKDFTTDWLTNKLDPWLKCLAPLRAKRDKKAILELGPFEGRSTVAMLEMFPDSHVTTVDTFQLGDSEDRFDRNLAPYGERCEKIKGRAVPAMDSLRRKKKTFDLIYLDAGKRRDDAFVQSVSAWTLLNVGGYAIWDDLTWKPDADPEDRPGPAIDTFAELFKPCLVELHRGKQLIVRKVSAWPV